MFLLSCGKNDVMGCVHWSEGGETNGIMRLELTSPSDLASHPVNPLPRQTPDARKASMRNRFMYQCDHPSHRPRRTSSESMMSTTVE